jgi:diguanylate cyclase (GGDEF)-like protein
MAAATREWALANRTRSPLSVAVIDLDNFKQVNDRAGHAAGDKLLAALGRQWRERIRPNDTLARHGGDEFVLLLPDTRPAGADAALKRLCSGHEPVSWSIGISEWIDGETLDAPLARADKQLYEAKLLTSEVRAHGPVARASGPELRAASTVRVRSLAD